MRHMPLVVVLICLALSGAVGVRADGGLLWSAVPTASNQPADQFPFQARGSAGMAAVRDELVLFGGYEECFSTASTCDNVWYNDVYAFNLQTKRWRRGNPSGERPEPRGYLGQVAYRGSAIIYGGGRYSTRLVDLFVYGDMWQYFPPTGVSGERWVKRTQIGPGPGPRMGPGLAVVGDHLYLFGGVSSILFSDAPALPGTTVDPDLLERHNDLWRFDLITNTWTQLMPDTGLPTPEPIEELQNPGRRHIAQFQPSTDGKSLYLYGGNTFAVGGQWSDLWIYDIASNTWSAQPFFSDENPNDPADNSKFVGRTHGASGVVKGRFIVTMGDKDHEASECDTLQPSQGQRPTNQTWVFDRSNAAWFHLGGVDSDGPPPPLKRVAFAQKDGVLYTFGGFGFDCVTGVRWNTELWALDMNAIP